MLSAEILVQVVGEGGEHAPAVEVVPEDDGVSLDPSMPSVQSASRNGTP